MHPIDKELFSVRYLKDYVDVKVISQDQLDEFIYQLINTNRYIMEEEIESIRTHVLHALSNNYYEIISGDINITDLEIELTMSNVSIALAIDIVETYEFYKSERLLKSLQYNS